MLDPEKRIAGKAPIIGNPQKVKPRRNEIQEREHQQREWLRAPWVLVIFGSKASIFLSVSWHFRDLFMVF